MMFRNFLGGLFCGLAVCPMLQAQQKPLWFRPPEAPSYYVVPVGAAQRVQLNGQPVLLAFSPDSRQLAIASMTDTGRTNEFGPVRAAELTAISTQQHYSSSRLANQSTWFVVSTLAGSTV